MVIEKKENKPKSEKPRDDVELENQFILRLPEEPARVLHEALQTGNLKDRMTIQLSEDLRFGEVRLDQWLLHAKLLDLPTIIESLKTIDNKNFYKSADICQILICKEEPDAVEPEKESPNKGKKKDPNKVDKKFLWPHGITPPCKNVRKRRFRKTLKKKNVDAPEIEKEVKRLLRVDNDAVKVEFEIINEDANAADEHTQDMNYADDEFNPDDMQEGDRTLNDSSSLRDVDVESNDADDERAGTAAKPRLAEHDIFGEELSSSDDEDDARFDANMQKDNDNSRYMADMSRLSADDTRMSSCSELLAGGNDTNTNQFKDESTNDFKQSMLHAEGGDDNACTTSNFAPTTGFYAEQKMQYSDDEIESYESQQQQQQLVDNNAPRMRKSQLSNKIADLRDAYNELKLQHTQRANEIAAIGNLALQQRMQDILDGLLSQMAEKEAELKQLKHKFDTGDYLDD